MCEAGRKILLLIKSPLLGPPAPPFPHFPLWPQINQPKRLLEMYSWFVKSCISKCLCMLMSSPRGLQRFFFFLGGGGGRVKKK